MHQKQPPAMMATAAFSADGWGPSDVIGWAVSAGPEQTNATDAINGPARERGHCHRVFFILLRSLKAAFKRRSCTGTA